MATLTSIRVLTAGLIGFIAWRGALWAIPLSMFMPCLVAVQPTRAAAGAASVAYYAAASVPLMAVAASYWPSIGVGAVLIWLTAAAILSLPWVLCWTQRKSLRPWTTAVAVGLTAIPPLCIVGWASPLVSAGVLSPNAAWLGVIATLALPGLLLHERTRAVAALTAGAAVILLNADAKPHTTPTEWEAEATCIHRQPTANELADLSIEERLQEVALSSKQRFVLFPEGAVRRWTNATDGFWASALAGSGKTLLINASEPIAGSARYNNSIVILSEQTRRAVHQRIQVPGGMWNPLRPAGSFALNLFDQGTADVGSERAAILICYEQLLTWPMLRSAAEKPTLLVVVSNAAWTASTVIPSVQSVCVRAWALLFGLPAISAINL